MTQAAQLCGKSRRTIQRYVRNGKLSVSKDTHGNPVVDTAELIRVFGALSHPPKSNLSQPVAVTNNDANLANMISEAIIQANKPLQEQIYQLTEELRELKNRLEPPKKEKVVKPPKVEKEVEKSSSSGYMYDIPVFCQQNKN